MKNKENRYEKKKIRRLLKKYKGKTELREHNKATNK